MYRHILIPTDGSKLAEHGVAHGLALAKSLGAKVSVIFVVEPFSEITGRFQEAVATYAELRKEQATSALGVWDKKSPDVSSVGMLPLGFESSRHRREQSASPRIVKSLSKRKPRCFGYLRLGVSGRCEMVPGHIARLRAMCAY